VSATGASERGAVISSSPDIKKNFVMSSFRQTVSKKFM